MFYSHFLGIVGELDQSTYHIERALQLDPSNPFVHGLYSIQLLMRNEHEQAIDAAEHALSMAPGYAFGYVTLILAHDTLGNDDAAIEAHANLFRYVAGRPEAADTLESLYRQHGYEQGSLQMARALEAMSAQTHVPPITIGAFYEQAGQVEEAIDWFEVAYEQYDPDAPYLGVNMKDPAIRSHPRYKALMERMGLDYWAATP